VVLRQGWRAAPSAGGWHFEQARMARGQRPHSYQPGATPFLAGGQSCAGVQALACSGGARFGRTR